MGSLRSPFVRTCRLWMMKNGIDFEFRMLNIIDDIKAAEELKKETPINRVPVLLDGDQKIFDSRVIINYLTKKHGLRSFSIEEENRISVIYSCMDTAISLFQLKFDGYDITSPGFFISRQHERIPKNFE
jgi:glutathione S-transferase